MARLTPLNKPKPTKEVSAMAWIENQYGDVLFLKQKAGRKFWTLPGGKVCRRESLLGALHREVKEETGLEIVSPTLCGIFERAEKDAITFLFRVKIRGSADAIKPNAEIASGRYGKALPRHCSPTLDYFWKQLRGARAEKFIFGRF